VSNLFVSAGASVANGVAGEDLKVLSVFFRTSLA